MASIDEVMEHFKKIKKPTQNDYLDHLNVILAFVDEQFYTDNTLINSFFDNEKIGYPVISKYRISDSKKYSHSFVEESLNAVVNSFSTFVLVHPNILSQEFLAEIKAMLRYFTIKVTSNKIIRNSRPMNVADHDLFYQAETYEYMFSFYDKINGLFYDLNKTDANEYEDSTRDMYFTESILKNIYPFTKDTHGMFVMNNVIQKMGRSTAWHYSRLLRNIIAHKSSDPNSNYNLALPIKLLYINICRIVFSLDATIMKDDEISEKLKNNNK